MPLNNNELGRSPDGSGSRASHEAAKASSPEASIPNADYAAMRSVIDPMIEAAHALPVEKLVAAMRGLYATSQSNCPWYAYGLRHALPPILATIGQDKDGYEEAWLSASAIEARSDTTPQSGAAEGESAIPQGDAQNTNVPANE